MTWAVLFCAGANLLSALSHDLQSLVITRVLAAVAAAAIIPLSLAWIGDTVDYAGRQLTLARFGLGISLGITGGQLAGGLLTDVWGWRNDWASCSTCRRSARDRPALEYARVDRGRPHRQSRGEPAVDRARYRRCWEAGA